MIKKIFHSSDWHYSHNRNKDNFWEVANNYLDKIKKIIKDENLKEGEFIQVIAGDLFDRYLYSSVDDFININKFLELCDEISKTFTFIGNHDYNINNPSQGDMLTKVFDHGSFNQTFFYRDCAIIQIDNITLYHISKYQNNKFPYDSISEFDDSQVNLGIYHDALKEASVDGHSDKFSFFRDKPSVEQFNGLDAVIMGDIHKRQVLSYETGNAVYAGSPFQVNSNENPNDHGFVVWTINSKEDIQFEFVNLKSLYATKKYKVSDLTDDVVFNPDDVLKITFDVKVHREDQKIIRKQYASQYGLKYKNVSIVDTVNIKDNISKDIEKKFTTEHGLKTLYDEYLKDEDQSIVEKFFEIDNMVNIDYDYSDKKNYSILYIRGQYIKSYGEFSFNFDEYNDFILINSNPGNYGGKSNFFNLFDILLFGKCKEEDETSTLDSIVNYYMPNNKDAFIEGMIECEGERYFIKREYKKSKLNKIKHSFFCYKIVTRDESNLFIEFNEEGNYIYQKDEVDDDMYGEWVLDLREKNNALTLKKFEQIIGTLEENNDISHFNVDNIKKLLVTKGAERTRNFYNLFGGTFFFNKRDIAQKLYSSWKKDSKIKNYDPIVLMEDIEINELNKADIEKQEQNQRDEYNITEKQLIDVRNKIEEFKSKIEYVPNLTPKEVYEHNLKNKKDAKEQLIETIKDDNYEDVAIYESQLSDLYAKLEYKGDDALAARLVELNEKEFVNTIFTNSEMETLDQEIDSKRITYQVSLSKLQDLETELKELLDDYNCGVCGKVISNQDKRKTLEKNITELQSDLKNIIQEGVTHKEQKTNLMSLYSDAKKTFETEKQEQIIALQNAQDKLIADFKNGINHQINEVNVIIKKIHANNITKQQLISLEHEIKSLEGDILKYDSYVKIIEQNKIYQDQIENLNRKGDILNSSLNAMQISLNESTIKIRTLENIIKEKKGILADISNDVLTDKAYSLYVHTHDKDGIIRNLVNQYLDNINDELFNIMSDLDFYCKVAIEKNIINYYIIREDKEYSLKEGSGLEKYASLLCLNLAHVIFSKSNICNYVRFDELFGPIHEGNLSVIIDIMKKYNKIFSKMFIVTHKTEVKEYFNDDSLLFIEKENNFSKIR